MLRYGAGADNPSRPKKNTLPKEEMMNKLIVAGMAVIALSLSPAFAMRPHHHAHAHHATKPAAATAAANTAAQTTWPFGGVSDADKKAYARNKRESGVK